MRRTPPVRERAAREPEEFEQKLIEIKRVTRVQKGGKRMRFRALVALGDKKGRAGYGLGKGMDVAQAIAKATAAAKKKIITVPLRGGTIPHPLHVRFKASALLLKPAPRGTGIKAGGAIRQVLAVAGVANVVAKMLGSKNKVNNVKATFKALQELKSVPTAKGLPVDQVNSNVKSDVKHRPERSEGSPGGFLS